MLVPISWLKDFVDITLPLPQLAHELTMAGLEVEEIRLVGLPLGEEDGEQAHKADTKVTGLTWAPDKIVVGEVREVMPHPNADRLVLCRLYDGEQENIVLTGAPNLYPYKGTGPLETPIKVAYAKEGAQIYDGHQPGQVLTTLKRAKIRGVESFSMACSEKELGISDEHEGIIFLDENAPAGMPLVEYMGDAVLEISIIPNVARALSILGVAREVAAITGQPLREPDLSVIAKGPSIEGKAHLEIQNPELNPRFVLGLVQNVEIKPSPYKTQLRLRLAGMRPINNIVDATNYAMLELGEPLHAFDFDVLVERAGGKAPTIITRTAYPGERLTTLDGVDRALTPDTVLVTDTAGPLSIAGIMGGEESEVSEKTKNILLEGAAWNFINIRKTATAQHLMSEAAYRFSRGVHPAMAEKGVKLGLKLMQAWADGTVDQGLIDAYPLPPARITVEIDSGDVRRWLGIDLDTNEIVRILRSLDFQLDVQGDRIQATVPQYRLDIGEGITGKADIMEEIARVYGYERIPETRLADELPPQLGDPALEKEERIRDLLVELGLQEVITRRMTSPEREARRLMPETPANDHPYVRLANPIIADRDVLRQSLLSSVLDVVERNGRLQSHICLFEIGPVFLACEDGFLPDELQHLAIVMTGPRELPTWQKYDADALDFYDLKGVIAGLLEGLHIRDVRYEPADYPSFHPGKSARIILVDDQGMEKCQLGVMGELHPIVREHYELPPTPVLAADLDLASLIETAPLRYAVEPVPEFPPVLEDLAVVVDETIPAEQVKEIICQAGGKAVRDVRLFDVYRGSQIGPGKKSLAYSLTYLAPDRTLTDEEVARIRGRIVRRLEQDLNATLRK